MSLLGLRGRKLEGRYSEKMSIVYDIRFDSIDLFLILTYDWSLQKRIVGGGHRETEGLLQGLF